MHIRRAAPGEAEALSALARRAKAHWGYSRAQLQAWRPLLQLTPEYLTSHPVFAAQGQGAVLGFYALCPTDTAWELDHLWVAPEHMGRGVGRALFSHALQTAEAGGAAALVIDADPHAEGFYRACGAQRIGELAAPIPDQPDRVIPRLVFEWPSRSIAP